MNRVQATQILMLDSNASFNDIKYAYRKLSLELHPDRNKNENDGRLFKNVIEAYHFLKNQSRLKNSHYDSKTEKKKSYTYQNTGKQNPPEEDWSKFTKDFEMDENFWRQYEKSFWEDYEHRKNEDKKNDYGKAFWNENEERINPKPKTKNQKSETKIYKHDLSVHVDESQCIACLSCETIAVSYTHLTLPTILLV